MTALLPLLFFCLEEDGLARAAERVVKIYGAGVGRVEGFGSGILLSADGRILTILSPMLQTESLRVVLADGRRRPAKVLGVDPTRQTALLKIDAERLPHFDLAAAANAEPGDVVYALGNAFNIAAGEEPVSVQRGVVSAKAVLSSRVGLHEKVEAGAMLILDAATNNPGAGGGALIDAKGRLVGLLGREMRSSATETWIHYALPLAGASPPAEALVRDAGATPAKANEAKRRGGLRGLIPLPEVFDQTPPYVDGVAADSPAARAGVQPDDLILFVGDELIKSVAELRAALERAGGGKPLRIVVQRGDALVTLVLPAARGAP